jgi:hypothetical protein
MMATEMPDTIRPYSMAAVPDSFFRKRFSWLIILVPLELAAAGKSIQSACNSKKRMVNESKAELSVNLHAH